MSQTKAQLVSNIVGNVTGGANFTGIVTAPSFVGNLTGNVSGIVTGTVVPQGQSVTSQSGTTTIDLNQGNIVYFTHNTDTTVAFANTNTTRDIRFIRTKDDTGTPRSITWPSSVKWPGLGYAPNLQTQGTQDAQIFSLVTNNNGVTWYAWEEYSFFGEGNYLFNWGVSGTGELGNNSIVSTSSPTQIPGTNWSSIYGVGSKIATKTDNTLWAWGSNYAGQIGQNTTTPEYSSPVQIPGTNWSSLAKGCGRNTGMMCLKSDSTLWVWGLNTSGQLGLNAATSRSSPTQIPGTNWTFIDQGSSITGAIKSDGTLWVWGSNAIGRLGQNTTTPNYSSPIQIPGTNWRSIACAESISLATKTDNTLWSWGYNTYGGVGQGDKISRSSPVQIPGTNWSSTVATMVHSSFAIKNDGSLWSWGYNNTSYGQLGQNNTISYSSPVQIPGTNWTDISSQSYVSLARKTDGTLWVWGNNGSGQYGENNTVVKVSSPRQIPGNKWSFSSVGTNKVSAISVVS